MNFTQITDEMIARGAESDSTRNGQWANQAYREIINAYEWPFTEAEATGSVGTGTVTIADFRKAIIVADKTTTPGRKLQKITMAELAEDFYVEDLATTGTPQYWYYDGVSGSIKSFPVGGTLYVKYYKRVSTLSGVQTPIFLDEYHPLIVARAMVEVYLDNDEFTQATSSMQFYKQGLLQMADDYQLIDRGPSYIQVGEPYDG